MVLELVSQVRPLSPFGEGAERGLARETILELQLLLAHGCVLLSAYPMITYAKQRPTNGITHTHRQPVITISYSIISESRSTV